MSVDKFGRYNHDGKNISVDLQDFASIGFLKNNCLLKSTTDNCYDAKNMCVRNVNLPSKPNDAANMQYVQSYGMGRTTGLHYTAGNKRITDLGDPVLSSDAASMGFVTENISNSLKRTHPDGDIDLEGKLLRNIAPPSLPTDAVNLEYLSKNTPRMYDSYWMFFDKKLSNVQDPQYAREVVNLRTLIKYLLKVTSHHEQQLKRFSSALFRYTHGHSVRSSQRDVTENNYLDMDAILRTKLFEREMKMDEEDEIPNPPPPQAIDI